MRSDSSQFKKFGILLDPSSQHDNLEIEIKVKRKARSNIDIKKQISPLLDLIQHDKNNDNFAEVFLKGKHILLKK
ncbi:hypothetical protein [Vibrio taketomensis]|uniref:hypothetical protein n=1 Tax=Vibrio taketomensis TaxID=2572923 RepID=UPI001389936C|nr:hypothetical protein [Vibrio taketomensis]